MFTDALKLRQGRHFEGCCQSSGFMFRVFRMFRPCEETRAFYAATDAATSFRWAVMRSPTVMISTSENCTRSHSWTSASSCEVRELLEAKFTRERR